MILVLQASAPVARQRLECDEVRGRRGNTVAIALAVLTDVDEHPPIRVVSLALLEVATIPGQFNQVANGLEWQTERSLSKLLDLLSHLANTARHGFRVVVYGESHTVVLGGV